MRDGKSWSWLWWLSLLGLLACQPQAEDQATRTRRLLAHAATQDSARQALSRYLFLPTDLPLLYDFLARPQPDDSLGPNSSRGVLLHTLADLNEPETVPFLEDHFGQWSAAHQQLALQALAQRGNRPASQALLRLLSQEATLPPSALPAVFGPYFTQPQQAAHLFPELLAMYQQPGYARYAFGLLRAALESGVLTAEALQAELPQLQAAYAANLRADAREHLLFVLAFFAAQPPVNQLLTEVMRNGPPPDRLVATLACLDQGIVVADSTLAALAAQPTLRNELYLTLAERDLLSRFPQQWRTRQAMAEGDLCAWLAQRYPAAGAPEAVGCFALAESGEWLFAYRFVHEGYWRSAISGPQPSDSSEVRAAGYLTSSELETYFGYGLPAQVTRILAAQDLHGLRLREAACP